MKNAILFVCLSISLGLIWGCRPGEIAIPLPAPEPDNDGLALPENFGAVVVVDSLGRGRHLTVRDNGDIYVHLPLVTEDGHSIICLRDTDHDAKPDIIEGFTGVPGTGIEIHDNHLYFASDTRIYRSALIDGQLVPDASVDTIVKMVDGSGHMAKAFAFDGQGNLYSNIGSMSNACQEKPRSEGSPGIDPCVELETRGGIWLFNDSEPEQEQSLEKRYATGLRNALALAWNPEVQSLYAVSHGRDDLHRFWPARFTAEQNVELPAEEFFQISEGDDFGWPYCYYDQINEKKLLNPEYGGDGIIAGQCAEAKLPLIGFPGHWGPNDLIFYQGDMFPEKYHGGAFIAFHGSWNRLGHPQEGYNVVFVSMENGLPSGDWEVFASGFTGAEQIMAPGAAKYRPCGLAEGPDGSLYIVDSMKGKVWRIFYYSS